MADVSNHLSGWVISFLKLADYQQSFVWADCSEIARFTSLFAVKNMYAGRSAALSGCFCSTTKAQRARCYDFSAEFCHD